MSWDGRGGSDLAAHHARVGAQLQEKGDLEGALRHYNRAVEVQPNFPGLLRSRGWVHYQRGDFQNALSDLNTQLETEPADPESYEHRARIRLAVEDFEGALRDYTWLVGRFPQESRVHRLRGLGFAEAGNLDRALDDTTFAVEVDSRNPETYVSRGWVRMRRGDLDQAAEDARRALRLDSTTAGALQLQGRLYLTAGDLKGAGEYLRESVKRGWPELSIAVLFVLEGRLIEARDRFERSLAALRGFPDLRDYAAILLWVCERDLGRTEDADGWLRRAMARPSPRTVDWTGRIASFLMGSSTEAEFRSAAASPSASLRAEREAQAAFYAGIRRRLAGDSDEAARCFQRCVDSRQISTYEWVMARAELATTGDLR
jgi:tetratricopeptide (TPR) repeat protein